MKDDKMKWSALAFGFCALKTIRFHSHHEAIRGCIVLPSQDLFVGSSRGYLYHWDLNDMSQSMHRMDKNSIDLMSGSRHGLLIKTLRQSFVVEPKSMRVMSEFQWNNMTMYEGIINNVYARLSSDHYLFLSAIGEEGKNITRRLSSLSKKSMIIHGAVLDHYLCLVSIDWKIILINIHNDLTMEEYLYNVICKNDIPIGVDIIRGPSPIHFRIAITTNNNIWVMDINTLNMKMEIVSNIEDCAKRTKFLANDAMIVVKNRRLELLDLGTSEVDHIGFNGEYSSSLCYMSPFLFVDADDQLLIARMRN